MTREEYLRNIATAYTDYEKRSRRRSGANEADGVARWAGYHLGRLIFRVFDFSGRMSLEARCWKFWQSHGCDDIDFTVSGSVNTRSYKLKTSRVARYRQRSVRVPNTRLRVTTAGSQPQPGDEYLFQLMDWSSRTRWVLRGRLHERQNHRIAIESQGTPSEYGQRGNRRVLRFRRCCQNAFRFMNRYSNRDLLAVLEHAGRLKDIYEELLGSEATSLPHIELAFDLFDRNVRNLQTAAETLEPVNRQAIYAELQREASGHNDQNLNRFWTKLASAFQT